MRGSWRLNKDCNILTSPAPSGHRRVLFSFSWTAQPGTWGPSLSGTCSHPSIFSPTGLQTQSGVPKAPSAGWWLSLPHPVFNLSDLQLHRGSRRPLLPGGGFPYHILSLTHLISNSIGGPEGPFCWVVAFPTTSL